jgi:ferredoxin-type protein NapF
MAAPDLQRRALLRGRTRPAALPLRPPWALDESSFIDACTRCGDCLTACPEGILAAAEGGFPGVDFGRGGCTWCGDCVDACAAGALRRTPMAPPWALAPVVADACLAHRGVHCQSCRDACEPEAVRFAYLGAVPVPAIDTDLCTGCGSCVAACPVDAIAMRHPGVP